MSCLVTPIQVFVLYAQFSCWFYHCFEPFKANSFITIRACSHSKCTTLELWQSLSSMSCNYSIIVVVEAFIYVDSAYHSLHMASVYCIFHFQIACYHSWKERINFKKNNNNNIISIIGINFYLVDWELGKCIKLS